MAATAANKNRKIRQDALREQLGKQKLVEKVLDIAKKFEEHGKSMEASEIQALRASADIRMKLINKYLPDLKSMEISGDEDNPLAISKIERTIVSPKPSDS